jgi:hypothetical protein
MQKDAAFSQFYIPNLFGHSWHGPKITLNSNGPILCQRDRQLIHPGANKIIQHNQYSLFAQQTKSKGVQTD